MVFGDDCAPIFLGVKFEVAIWQIPSSGSESTAEEQRRHGSCILYISIHSISEALLAF